MSKRIDLRIDEELNDDIEKIRLDNNLDSKQEVIKILLNEDLKRRNNFIYRLKNLFKF